VSSRTLLILLIVSLTLNLFIVGALAGAGVMLMNLQQPPPAARPPQGGAMMQAAGVLSQDQREAYKAMVQTANASVGKQNREARLLRRGAWVKLATDPVDVNGITGDLDRARDLENQARHVVEARIVAFAADLSQDDRARLADRLSAPPQNNNPQQQQPPQAKGQAAQQAQPQAQPQ
jgi:uncharacterized membrane protein